MTDSSSTFYIAAIPPLPSGFEAPLFDIIFALLNPISQSEDTLSEILTTAPFEKSKYIQFLSEEAFIVYVISAVRFSPTSLGSGLDIFDSTAFSISGGISRVSNLLK